MYNVGGHSRATLRVAIVHQVPYCNQTKGVTCLLMHERRRTRDDE